MIYSLGIFISLAAGFLLIRLFVGQRLNLIIHILLALALGLGIDGLAAFYVHIFLNQFNRWLPISLVVLGIVFLIKYYSPPKFQMTKEYAWGLVTLALLAVPLAICAHYYPLGGWDAWSCWNLKTKFIFLDI